VSDQPLRDIPLHELSPTTRFTDRAADYVKYRPSYPPSIIDAILEGLGDPSTLTAADVGAGTGISSRLLADRGVNVIAIDPNAAMRTAAEPHPRVQFRDGTAESTGLPEATVNLVTCFQAFHWVRQDEALREFAHILRPERSRIAIVWNERDRADPLMTAYRDAIRAVGGEHPAELREFDPQVIARSGLFSQPVLVEAPNAQRLDERGLVGRALSASYAPNDGEGGESLRASLVALHARFRDRDGLVTLRYTTRAWAAARLPTLPLGR
jgi:SAM-dependent methyltransferase